MSLLQVTGDAVWLLAAGPLGGLVTYWAIYRYYRNHDKSHAFETETLIDAGPVRGEATKVSHIAKTRDGCIQGANATNHRARVQPLR